MTYEVPGSAYTTYISHILVNVVRFAGHRESMVLPLVPCALGMIC